MIKWANRKFWETFNRTLQKLKSLDLPRSFRTLYTSCWFRPTFLAVLYTQWNLDSSNTDVLRSSSGKNLAFVSKEKSITYIRKSIGQIILIIRITSSHRQLDLHSIYYHPFAIRRGKLYYWKMYTMGIGLLPTIQIFELDKVKRSRH